MGFIPPIIAAVSSAAAGIGSAAAGGISSLAGGASSLIGGGAASAAGSAAGGSALSSLAVGAGNLGLGLLPTLALKPPKPPAPPQPPNIGSALSRVPSLIAPTEGTFNDTLVSGSNRAKNISGGKKTLGGS